jgi:hypothetical protein
LYRAVSNEASEEASFAILTHRLQPIRRTRELLGSEAALWLFGLAALLDLFSWLSLALRLRPSSYQVPVHYSSRFGVDMTGPWYSLFYLPLVGLVLLVINIALARWMRTRSRVLVHFVAAATALVEALLLITTFLFLGRL